MVLIHQRAEQSPVSRLDFRSCNFRNPAHLIKYLLPFLFIRFPKPAHVRHGFFRRRGDSGITDDNSERRTDFEYLNRLTFDEVHWFGIRDYGIVNPRRCAMMDFFDVVYEVVDIFVGHRIIQVSR